MRRRFRLGKSDRASSLLRKMKMCRRESKSDLITQISSLRKTSPKLIGAARIVSVDGSVKLKSNAFLPFVVFDFHRFQYSNGFRPRNRHRSIDYRSLNTRRR
ncbi:unnamed protein product [Rhodiola kirilowii]